MMAPIAEQIREQVAGVMAGKADAAFRGLADELLPGWTVEDLATRFRFIRRPGVNVSETLYFDGVAVAEFGPMEMKSEQRDQSWVQTFSRSFRRLV